MKLEISLDNLTKPQLLALVQFFKNWKRLCSIGSSRYVSFYVDGDGNLHPEIKFNLPNEITQEDLKLAEDCYTDSLRIDFDKIAWELRKQNVLR